MRALARSSSREVLIRVPFFFSVVYCRGVPNPPNQKRNGKRAPSWGDLVGFFWGFLKNTLRTTGRFRFLGQERHGAQDVHQRGGAPPVQCAVGVLQAVVHQQLTPGSTDSRAFWMEEKLKPPKWQGKRGLSCGGPI